MQQKKIKWHNLAMMTFSTVWGFGNVCNGFVYFSGVQVIFSWLFMFLLYFIPYALMVGELGCAFKEKGGGVSSWISETMGTKLAYFAGWTYWAVHVTYIANKSSAGLKALSWLIFRNASTYDTLSTTFVQLMTLAVLALFCWIACRGLNPLKKIATIAGAGTLIMSLLYILMMFAAPAINPAADYVALDLSFRKFIPQFNVGYFTSLSILVFAVGGCEKTSPYVNKVENPSTNFPKVMIFLAIMVSLCAILGTIAMSKMFDPAVINSSEQSFNSYVSNCQYWAFQKLGGYYHIGDTLMLIYALSKVIGEFGVLIVSIDAPLRMLLANTASSEYIPQRLLKTNRYGSYANGIRLVFVLSGTLILIQSTVPNAATVIAQFTKLNSVCMPMRFLWVFIAYIMLRCAEDKYQPQYRFVKSKTVGILAGVWCFAVTAICCLMGMYDRNPLTMALNICTPVILVALGLILPKIAKAQKEKSCAK